tara:strand:- start:453 stop:905 length:453 start_codon:yes stop_codon:yes gene_type:complete
LIKPSVQDNLGFCRIKLFIPEVIVMEIDFTKKKLLTESWLKGFATWNKTLLKYMYGKDVNMVATLGNMNNPIQFKEGEGEKESLKFTIRGEEEDVRAYAQAITAEKEYLDLFVKHGADHPQSQKAKEKLDQAVGAFEQTTGITWPFKDEG